MKKLFLVIVLGFILTFFVNSFEVDAKEKKSYMTKEQVMDAVSGYSMTCVVNEEEQRFGITSEDISKITIKSQKLSSDGKTLTVKAYIYIDRDVAIVKSLATIKYKLKKSEWKVKSVSFSKTVLSKISLKGTWKSTIDYTGDIGEAVVIVKVKGLTKDGYITDGVLEYKSTPTHKIPEGSCSIDGGYDLSTGKICFFETQWIEKPSNYVFEDFDGYVNLKNKSISGTITNNRNWEFDFIRTK